MATTQEALRTTLGTEPITAEQLMEMDERGELIRGVFCPTMIPGIQHGQVMANITMLLGLVMSPNKLGTIVTANAGVLLGRNPDTVLGPDISYFSRERLPLETEIRGYAEVPPELVVEVVSPSDTPREVAGKANMWLVGGVQLVWVVWPETKMVEIYRPDNQPETLREADTLTGGEVLPHFTVTVADIFEN
ncbi:MAG: Uma2 family endonuclease [Chloroflexi bacterium]|nr:Uma2 family endonuclease [Chloroflexota bacterium]